MTGAIQQAEQSPAARADRGAWAEHPGKLGWTAWREILGRVWINSGTHNLGLLAAGVAFYAFLSFVPLLGALVMSYGLVADPSTVGEHMKFIIDLVPADAARLIYEQLINLTTAAAGKKGLALLIALAVSIYGATRASGAIMAALNVIYEQTDRRSILRFTLISFVLIIGAVLIGVFGLLAMSMLAFAQTLAKDLGPLVAAAIRAVTWLGAAVVCSATIAAMYRYAPDRADARWRWLSVGSLLSTVLWLGATILFGFYAKQFGDYNATYGSLGAVVVLLLWLYVSAYAVLLGGMINAEAERQVARDTTTGPPQPMGSRGAVVADMSVAIGDAPNDGLAKRPGQDGEGDQPGQPAG